MADQQAAAMAQNTPPAEAGQDFRTMSRAEQRRVLVDLIEQGHSDEEIGQQYGLSQWQVRNLRYRLGIKKDRGGNIHIEQADKPGPDGAAALGGVLQAFPGTGISGSALFAVTMAGLMNAEQLARRLEGMRALFDSADPEKRFEVRIQVTEAASGN